MFPGIRANTARETKCSLKLAVFAMCVREKNPNTHSRGAIVWTHIVAPAERLPEPEAVSNDPFCSAQVTCEGGVHATRIDSPQIADRRPYVERAFGIHAGRVCVCV